MSVFLNSVLARSLSRRGALAALAAALPGAGLLQAAKEWTTLRILVRDERGRPVPRASVIVRQLKGKQKKLKRKSPALELKTSNEGSTPVPPLPRGPILIQVISKGFRTHGAEVALTEPEQTETIILKPPSDQISVHKE
ncbi:MAG: carboxypeptidase regulatory-like domain-containing protein [Acidobacteriia bacterium]|nr:carboxypeptidase regulatory-like domain-containing protein [Terriglobia bacterium]MYG04643.1 carboxypeptidase regulatory-like domain-containing protein [Terriglobia bacterium]MYK08068.1 carboxypeptidase regulatory-like domain-containing protein [Terriglobia bacterium]